MARNITFNQTDIQALESPIYAVETDSVTFACTFWTTVSSVTAVTCYVNKQDKTSTLMPSGSHSVSGKVATLKPLAISALTGAGGRRIVVNVKVVINSDTVTKQFVVIVRKDEVE